MARAESPSFAQVYERGFDYVWRTLRALGVDEVHIDDAVQDAFVVVARRLAEFEGRARLETWLFAIARRIARGYRRSAARRSGRNEALPEQLPHAGPGPDADAERADAARQLGRLLDTLDDDKRAIFVLVEVQGFTVPEAAETLRIKLNTAYSRLRHARRRLEAAAARTEEPI